MLPRTTVSAATPPFESCSDPVPETVVPDAVPVNTTSMAPPLSAAPETTSPNVVPPDRISRDVLVNVPLLATPPEKIVSRAPLVALVNSDVPPDDTATLLKPEVPPVRIADSEVPPAL